MHQKHWGKNKHGLFREDSLHFFIHKKNRREGHSLQPPCFTILTSYIEIDEPFVTTNFVGGYALVHNRHVGFLDDQIADRLVKTEKGNINGI